MVIEKELKYLISKEEFECLKSYFTNNLFTKKNIININYYFDNEYIDLSSIGITARLRKIFKNKYEFTIKCNINSSISNIKIKKEFTNLISENIAKKILEDEEISIDNPIFNEMKEIKFLLTNNTISSLFLIKSPLITFRNEYTSSHIDNMIFFLDKNTYLGKVDYEFEVEIYEEDLLTNINFIKNLLKNLNIDSNKISISKNKRFKNDYYLNHKNLK